MTLSRSYDAVEKFKVGDIVKWKPGMRNRRMPEYNQPVVVSAVFDSVQYGPETNTGSPYFREPETIKVAFVDEDDNEFVEFGMDGRRFMHMPEQDCAPRKVQELRERLRTLLTRESPLKVGDRVYWKPGMKHKRRPDHEPAVVVELLEQPLLDEDKPGSQYWHEPLDVKIGMYDQDGEFVCYYFDSRRFHAIADDDETYGDKRDDDSDSDHSGRGNHNGVDVD